MGGIVALPDVGDRVSLVHMCELHTGTVVHMFELAEGGKIAVVNLDRDRGVIAESVYRVAVVEFADERAERGA